MTHIGAQLRDPTPWEECEFAYLDYVRLSAVRERYSECDRHGILTWVRLATRNDLKEALTRNIDGRPDAPSQWYWIHAGR